jgi:hypothetical protein
MSELLGAPHGYGGPPAPPQGPGVAPPFAAPPRDRDNKRLWIGLGVSGLVIVLCCVGGILGIGVIASGSEDLVRGQASSVVRTYLEALQEQSYADAYDQLCDKITQNLSRRDFEVQVGRPAVTGYTIGEVEVTTPIIVNASVTQSGRAAVNHRYEIVQSGTALQICGGL